MVAAAGLLLTLVCLAIVALGFALAFTAWRPSTGGPAATVACAAGLAAGAAALLLGSLHWLAHLLT
ncbi:hypothetical protein [Streptomyces griseosporeus]|uniref:hypothetical protein n=1 Tax=Streptomyces griseosporeus TaxID=1910 RepID=UPI003701C26E